MIDPGTLLVRNNAILFSEIGDDIVALSVERGDCFGMEEVSAAVWRMLDKPISPSEICDRLTQKYEVEPTHCHDDIRDLLNEMLERGLILPLPTLV